MATKKQQKPLKKVTKKIASKSTTKKTTLKKTSLKKTSLKGPGKSSRVAVKTAQKGKTAPQTSRVQPAAKKPSAPPRKLTPRERSIQEIKKILLQQKFELLSEAEEALNALPGQTIFPDMGDQASAEIDRNFMLRLRGREQKLLKKIEQAIEKIDGGTFGVCDVCGEEINLKRLEARPVTNMCIFCKTEQEEEEKLRGR